VLTKLRNNGFGQSGTIIAAINLSDPDRVTVAYAHIESWCCVWTVGAVGAVGAVLLLLLLLLLLLVLLVLLILLLGICECSQ